MPAIRVTFQGNLFGSGGHVFRSLSWYEIASKLAWIKYVFKANEIDSTVYIYIQGGTAMLITAMAEEFRSKQLFPMGLLIKMHLR